MRGSKTKAVLICLTLLLTNCANIRPQQYDNTHPANPKAQEAPTVPQKSILQSYQSSLTSPAPDHQPDKKDQSGMRDIKHMDMGPGSGQNGDQVQLMPGMNMPDQTPPPSGGNP